MPSKYVYILFCLLLAQETDDNDASDDPCYVPEFSDESADELDISMVIDNILLLSVSEEANNPKTSNNEKHSTISLEADIEDANICQNQGESWLDVS